MILLKILNRNGTGQLIKRINSAKSYIQKFQELQEIDNLTCNGKISFDECIETVRR